MTNHTRPVFLSIQGTVLVCREKWWTGDLTWYVPIEWVKVGSGRRREQRWLPRGPLVFAGLLLASLLLPMIFADPGVQAWTVIVFFLAAVVSVPVTLILWKRRRPTVVLEAEPAAEKRWEFYEDPDPRGAQRRFLEDLKALQARIHDLEPFAAKSSFASRTGRRWRELVSLTFLFLLPAWVTDRAGLLWLGLLPIGWGILQEARLLVQPEPFRRALRSARRERYEEAFEALLPWVRANPPHRHALELLWEACVESGRWDEALAAAGRMREVHPERAREMEEDAWLLRRIRERMRKNV